VAKCRPVEVARNSEKCQHEYELHTTYVCFGTDFEKFSRKYKAFEFNCLDCGHKFILGRHAGHGNLQRSQSITSLSSAPFPGCCPKCECNKIDARLKDDTQKLFGDWDIPNILGLEPPKMIISLIGPNLILFSIVLTIQYCYIFYIQEVVGDKMETHEIQGYIMCYGAEQKEAWDTQEPKVLRVVCLLTFLTEFFRVRLQHCDICVVLWPRSFSQ
jgi:hypothetical protein